MKNIARLFVAVLATAAILLGQSGVAFAQAGGTSLSFDHTTTGYFLDTTHKLVGCESCHTGGVFRGTPRTCATCHAGAGARAQGKSATHIPTTAACDSCHRPGASNWNEKPTGFITGASGHAINPQQGVTSTNCQTCHSGAYLGANALTKPATHIQTSSACSACHNTTAWWPATNPHAGVTPGTCATCHNGAKAKGKSGNHIPTAAACDSCHSSFDSFATATMSHAGTGGQCSSCHSGRYSQQNARAKQSTHISTGLQCDSCHLTTTSWIISFDHSNPTMRPAGTPCATCHDGSTAAVAQSSRHIPTRSNPALAACDTCHSSTSFDSFRPATMTTAHSLSAGQCASCHNGAFMSSANAQGPSGLHFPTQVSCDSCHTAGFSSWGGAKMNHAGLEGKCRSCHTGGYLQQNAQTVTSTHVKTSAQCDTCHASTLSWATRVFNHAGVSPAVAGRCSSCHNGTSSGIGKSVNHIPTSGQCDSCHTTFSGFASANMNHTGTAGICNDCHKGDYAKSANAQARSDNHIPSSTVCDTCHTASFTSWSPAVMSHSGLSGQCSNCHNGNPKYVLQNIQAQSATHVMTTKQCDTCHGSTTTWAVVKYTHDAAAAANKCDTCHGASTSNALPKPTGAHIPTTAQCDNCHKDFSAFKPAAMNHAVTSGTTCVSCHNDNFTSQNALAKTKTHIQTNDGCETCHGTGYQTWALSTFNHANIGARACSGCHDGVNAQGLSKTHIPTANACNTCHNTGAFKPAAMNHQATAGLCSTCHNANYASQNAQMLGSSHIKVTEECDTCHKNGYVTWSPAAMDHTLGSVKAQACKTCHDGTYISQNAQKQSSTHEATNAACSSCHLSTTSWAINKQDHSLLTTPAAGRCSSCHNNTKTGIGLPTNHLPTGGAQCDICHNTSAFKPATVNHNSSVVVAAGQCRTCHGGGYTTLGARDTASKLNHVQTSQSCDSCHMKTAWKPATYSHTGVAAGTCRNCHNGSSAMGMNMSTHIPTLASCDLCHASKLPGGFSTHVMNHTGLTGQCKTCHDGGKYISINALNKPTIHPVTNDQCDSCHAGTTTWASATYVHANPPGVCSSCHNGSRALGKNASTHVPTNAACDTCHTNQKAFKPAMMNHTGTTGVCSTCHDGRFVGINALAKSSSATPHVTTNDSCDTCHSTQAWKPANFAHSNAAPGSCSGCHNNTKALGKNLSTHIPTSASCDLCHTSYVSFSNKTMNHTGTSGQCSSCHDGRFVSINALAKTSINNHVSTTNQCDSCHKSTTTWANPNYTHASTAVGTCSNCHGGNVTGAKAKTAGTHIPTNLQCDSCHKGYTSFASATMDHTGTAGKCTTCHIENYKSQGALPKPTTGHIPTSLGCDSCHKNFTAFSSAIMDHTGQTGKCLTCHGGAYPRVTAKPLPSHQGNTAVCDVCHLTTSWSTTTFSHSATQLAGKTCVTCHNGSSARGKPVVHIPNLASESCGVCHRTGGSWTPIVTPYAHVGVTAACASCHIGTYNEMEYKTGFHVPTTAACDTCHIKSNWTTTTFAHAGATDCQGCHTGLYLGVLGKHSKHVPTTLAGLPGNQCSNCHKNTTSFTTVSKMNHGSIRTGCKTCHNSPSAYDTGGARLVTTGSHKRSVAGDDCTKSGCHSVSYSDW